MGWIVPDFDVKYGGRIYRGYGGGIGLGSE